MTFTLMVFLVLCYFKHEHAHPGTILLVLLLMILLNLRRPA
jgi:hypothetical protein